MSPPPPSTPVVIVSGPPRSGTSLVMQMLVAAGLEAVTDGQRRDDADNPRGYFEHARIMRLAQDASVLADAQGKAVKIIHALLAHVPAELPLAVIFLQRDLDEVIASQAAMLERLGRPASMLPPQRLGALLGKQLAQARAALDHRAHTQTFDLAHRALLTEPKPTAQALAAFLEQALGRPVDAAAMADCVNPSLYRQRGAS